MLAKITRFISNSNEKTAIFVNVRNDLEKVARVINGINPGLRGRAFFVFFNSQVPEEFQKPDIDGRISEDYLGHNDYSCIDEFTIDLTRNWYSMKGEDGKGITEIEGTQLGSLTELDFVWSLGWRIKNLEVMKTVIDREKPGRIIVIEDTGGELDDAAGAICRAKKIPLLSFRIKPARHTLIFVMKKAKSYLSYVLFYCALDPLVRFWLMRNKLSDQVLIDPRAYNMLTGAHDLQNFIFCPLDAGWSDRKYAFSKKRTYISFNIPLHGKLRKGLKRQKKELLAKWSYLEKKAAFSQTFVYKGIPIWGFTGCIIREYFKEVFPLSLRVITELREFHKLRKIKAVVLRGDVRAREKTFVVAARLLNVPTLYVTHGVLAEENSHDKLYCTKTAVWGKADFGRYLGLNVPKERMRITGSPKYDALYSGRFSFTKEEICKKLGLQDKKEFIILATQPVGRLTSYRTDDQHEISFRAVLAVINGMESINLVIKVHPSENIGYYRRLLKKTKVQNAVITREIDVFSLIKASRALITYSSTIGLEALILDKPLITINLEKRGDALPFAEKKAAFGVHKIEDIPLAIEMALGDGALNKELAAGRKGMVTDYVGELDGRSSERVVKLINGLNGND